MNPFPKQLPRGGGDEPALDVVFNLPDQKLAQVGGCFAPPVSLRQTDCGLELLQGTTTQLQRRTAHTLNTFGTLLFNERQVAAACGFKNLDRD